MGTSKTYGSPKWPGVNHTVGDAVSSGGLSDQKVSAAVGAFASAFKNYLTTGTRAPSSGGVRRAGTAQRPSGGHGGGSGTAVRVRSANSGARLARFISIASQSGLNSALREFDLSDLRDKPLDEFLDFVAARLSGDGGLLDDNALNLAIAETLDELAETVDSVDKLDTLLTSGNINIEAVLQVYFANIIAANFEQKEYSFVREKISREHTNDFFLRARQIIRSIVRDELSQERDLATIDWNSVDGQRIADEINHEVLDILIP